MLALHGPTPLTQLSPAGLLVIVDIFNKQVTAILYADDVKLYSVITSLSDSNRLQTNLNSLVEWSNTWQLQLSCSKCFVIHIGRYSAYHDISYKLGSSNLASKQVASDLGVTIDNDLSFYAHINNIVRKAHQRANLILRCFISKHSASLIKAFKVYVRPILEYNSPAWSPSLKKYINLIEDVQRRFTKRIPDLFNFTYHQRLTSLNLESLEMRRLRADLTLVYRILFGSI